MPPVLQLTLKRFVIEEIACHGRLLTHDWTRCFFLFFLGYRGIVHPPSDDEGTERTWFEPEQRPRKHVPKRSVHGKQSRQGASKRTGAKTTSPDGKAGHVMTHVYHRIRQEERQV